ncbi:MAG: sigma 54-interacting transcriptional regulator, partial [bacterium]|nr:sigma 54-interacting transcriptional regulator [bacterium]
LFDSTAEELPEALNRMTHQIMAMFNASSGAILLRTSSGEATPLVAFSEDDELRIGNEVLSVVLSEGKAVLTAALTKATSAETRPRPRKAMIVPLPHQDRIAGALYAARSDGDEYTEEDLSLLQALAHIVSGAVRHAIQMEQLVLTASRRPATPFIGTSPASQAIREQIARVGASEATVLLTGETGTGKELAAQMIHNSSARQKESFVAIDCSAIPANLIESELFGHEAGAFTGADHLKRGKVEMAEGGTLFLDEIGEMAIALQPKLLRFIEELAFYRVGGVRPIQSDVRIVAATNRNLDQAVREGRFRQDLLFRLNVLPIHLPPLRERVEDVRPLVEYFAPPLANRLGKPFLGLVDETWALLERYPWPGNVRELRHSLERALILSDDGILRPEHFQLRLPETAPEPSTGGRRPLTSEPTQPMLPLDAVLPPTMAVTEAEAIRRALRFAGGNRVRAAQILDIHRNTLAKKIQEYGIEI